MQSPKAARSGQGVTFSVEESSANSSAVWLPIGAPVQYYSRSQNDWIPARITGHKQAQGYYELDVQPMASVQRVRALPSGTEVYYYSSSASHWIPTVVRAFDAVHGTYQTDVQSAARPWQLHARVGAGFVDMPPSQPAGNAGPPVEPVLEKPPAAAECAVKVTANYADPTGQSSATAAERRNGYGIGLLDDSTAGVGTYLLSGVAGQLQAGGSKGSTQAPHSSSLSYVSPNDQGTKPEQRLSQALHHDATMTNQQPESRREHASLEQRSDQQIMSAATDQTVRQSQFASQLPGRAVQRGVVEALEPSRAMQPGAESPADVRTGFSPAEHAGNGHLRSTVVSPNSAAVQRGAPIDGSERPMYAAASSSAAPLQRLPVGDSGGSPLAPSKASLQRQPLGGSSSDPQPANSGSSSTARMRPGSEAFGTGVSNDGPSHSREDSIPLVVAEAAAFSLQADDEPEVASRRTERRFKCPLCLDEAEVEQGVSLDCYHKLCVECFGDYCNSKIGEGKVMDNELVCPATGAGNKICGRTITVEQVRGNVTVELFNKFCQFRTANWTPSEDDGRLLRCPTPGCAVFMVSPGVDVTSCPQCRRDLCAKCGRSVHKGMSCEEAEQRENANSTEGDKQFEELLVAQGWQKCPTCRTVTELAHGCYFMQCHSEKCRGKVHFCYICGELLKEEDHALGRSLVHFPRGPYNAECINVSAEEYEKRLSRAEGLPERTMIEEARAFLGF